MAVKVKPLDQSAQKYATNAQAGGQRYQENAVAAGGTWLSATVAAQQSLQQAISQAGFVARWARGVQRAGSEKYTNKIATVGMSRYSEGVSNASDEWQSGFEPYASVIAGLTLPQRRPRGDPGNYARGKAVGDALNARRLALLGSS